MKNSCIKSVKARQILDCRGRPAIEVDVTTNEGIKGRGAAPTGNSVGMHEAYVLRDNDPSRFLGMSVFSAIDNINNIIAPVIKGIDVLDQGKIDDEMIQLDGTYNKSNLGGNAIYSVSIACIKAAALTKKLPLYQYIAPDKIKTLPIPTFNTINGGDYVNISLPFQEYTFIPYRAGTIMEAVEIGCLLFKKTGDVIQEVQQGIPAGVGNYWGLAPSSDDPFEVFKIMNEAAEQCGVADKVCYALDCAASEMYNPSKGVYNYRDREICRDELIDLLKNLTDKHNFLYIEDPLDENDWEGWQLASKIINKTNIVGDDLTVTNVNKLKKGIETNAFTGFIFKPNQVGTITESITAYEYAKSNNILIIPSIRAGGIVDDIVMDMAVALETCATKQGPPRTGERTYAINFLLRSEDEIPNAVPFDFEPYVKF